jgi:hypothetical protein
MPRTIEIAESELQELARQAAGNWQDFDSFAWHDQPRDPEQWALVYTHNRDSGLVDQSNADAIRAELEPFMGRTVIEEHHGHWACGWVDGFAIRVYRRGGEITRAFRKYCELQRRLEDYRLLDEEDYSRREWEATQENLTNAGNALARSEDWVLPDGWESEVSEWFDGSDEHRHALESRDDQGGYPSDDELRAAFNGLEFEREGMRRCPSCDEWCADHEMIPGPIDDAWWVRESSDHADDCAWLHTRAGRILA